MPDFGLEGAFDLHVHCGPEAIPRKYPFLQLAREVKASGMAGAVAKSHFHSTAPWAAAAAEEGAGPIFGSIVLNHYVGGINPDAVRASLGISIGSKRFLKIVWMPTLHAEAHLKMQMAHGQEYDIPTEWTAGEISAGRQRLDAIRPIHILKPDMRDRLYHVLELIAENRLVLATGHLSREEVLYLVPLASSMGIRKIILTHPLYGATALTDSDVRTLCSNYPGVYAEQSYGLILIDKLPLEAIVRQIRAAGPEHTVLTTDLGQKQNVSPAHGLQLYLDLLRENGFSSEELKTMVQRNPHKLLG